MASGRITGILAATLLAFGLPIAASAASQSPVIATDNGPIRGTTVGAMQAFRGIPYAAAPVGDLRWRAPQPHPGWHGVLDASQFGAHCPQVATPYGTPSTTEDCLFLNVYTPGKTSEGRPHL